MTTRILLPAITALTLCAAGPASAGPFGHQQGGGGAGPYTLNCKVYENFHQRQRCTQITLNGAYYGDPRYAHRGARPGTWAGPRFW
jgi:hypothetical protein